MVSKAQHFTFCVKSSLASFLRCHKTKHSHEQITDILISPGYYPLYIITPCLALCQAVKGLVIPKELW